MRIGFDIDGTITNFEKFVLDNSKKYMKKKYGIELKNYNGYDIDQVYDIENSLIEKGYSIVNAKIEAEKVLKDFWNKYYFKYILTPIRKGVKKTINKLYNEDNEIFIISSRKKACENNIIGKIVKEAAILQLTTNNIKYHNIIFTKDDEEKLKAIKRNYIDIMIDDKPELLEKISKFTDAICINNQYNINNQLPEKIIRTNSYENNEVYDAVKIIIKKLKKPIIEENLKISDKPSIDKIWLKKYSVGDYKWSLTKESPYDRMITFNTDYPNRKLISYKALFKSNITVKEFQEKVDACAKKLSADGIGKNDIVSLLVVNTPETAIMICALMKIMATIVPISPTESKISIETKLKKLKPKMIYIVDYFNNKEKQFVSKKVNSICENLNINNIIYSKIDNVPFCYIVDNKLKLMRKDIKPKYDCRYTNFNDYVNQGRLIESELNIKYDENYIATIIHSGGTVEPKMIMTTGKNIDSEIKHFLSTYLNIKRGEKISGVLPYDHVYGLLINLIVPISLGMEIIQRPKVNRKRLDLLLTKNKINDFATIPVLLDEIINNPYLKKEDLSYVKQVFSGSTEISEEKLKEIKNFFEERNVNINIIDGYGSSELTSMFLENGIPIMGANAKIIDPISKKELGYNQIGELCACSDTVMAGYYKNDKKTTEALQVHDDGKIWLHTGDLAFIDEKGKIHYNGRVDQDIIKVNGQTVNLYDVSKIIETNKFVETCVTIGAHDDEKGNIPVLIIKLKNNVPINEIIEKEILDLCETKLSYYERPKRIFFTNNIPYTFRGKIDKKNIERIYNNDNVEKNDYVKVLVPKIKTGGV